MTDEQTHTLQVWPGGRSYEYHGDPNGPPEQRALRTEFKHFDLQDSTEWDGPECLRWLAEHVEGPHHYAARADDWAGEVARFAGHEGEDPEAWERRALDELRGAVAEHMEALTWRDGHPDEWRGILLEVRAEMYQERDVLTCDSMLVDELIKWSQCVPGDQPFKDLAEGFSYDEIRNFYPNADAMTVEQCREWLSDHGMAEPEPNPWTMDRDTLTAELEGTGTAVFDEESNDLLADAVAEGMDAGDIDGRDEWRTAVQDNAEPAEVYEWWRVSSWLCDQLHSIGEVTIDNGYGRWWGRCCTGQGYIMDGVLQRIAAQFD